MNQISAKVAIAFGLILPLLETIRRWREPFYLFSIVDDYLLGIILVVCGYLALRQPHKYQALLVGAWGIAIGGFYYSLVSSYEALFLPRSVIGFSIELILSFKIVLATIVVACFWHSLSVVDRSR
jgi:hypothetical protein